MTCIPVMTKLISSRYSSVQCHMIFQKLFQYARLELKNNFLLLSMMKTVVLINELHLHFAFKFKKTKDLKLLSKDNLHYMLRLMTLNSWI